MYEIISIGGLSSCNDVRFGGIKLSIGNIVTNGIIEKHGVLGHDPDVAAKRGNGYIPGVFAGLLVIIVIGVLVENLLFSQLEQRTVQRWGMTVTRI